jgi:hypothetical protein
LHDFSFLGALSLFPLPVIRTRACLMWSVFAPSDENDDLSLGKRQFYDTQAKLILSA